MSTNTELRILAEQLPPLPQLDKNGQVITRLQKNYELQRTGLRLTKVHVSTVTVPLTINHFDMLKKAYKLGGKEAVKEYVLRAQELHETIKKEKEEKKQANQGL